MQRFVPPDQRKKVYLQQKASEKKGPLALFMEQDDPRLVETLLLRRRRQVASDEQTLLQSKESETSLARPASAVRRRSNGILVGSTAATASAEKRKSKPFTLSRNVVYISEPNLSASSEKFLSTTSVRRASAPVVGTKIIEEKETSTRRASSSTQIKEMKKPRPALDTSAFDREQKRYSLVEAFPSKHVNRVNNSGKYSSSSLQKWSLGREKRAQLLQKLSRPATTNSVPTTISPENAYSPGPERERADSVSESLKKPTIESTLGDVVIEERPKSQISRSSSLQKSSSQKSISSTSSFQSALASKPSRLPVSMSLLRKSATTSSSSIATEESLFVRKDPLLIYGQLPVRKLQLPRHKSSREEKGDIPSIECLDISTATMYQPQVRRPKPVVSKPEKSIVVDLLATETASTEDNGLQLEFKPSYLSVSDLDQFVL